ncbi:hypothetical protein QNH39_26405 [Neobacillus novalis]|uniref:Uncharacterized protein n=1 Tax=Neobacillus novalis TaxID=220687 RepID=A0AA95MQ81_9BACI|nr:hypothetical protein [Neobacillus novalis]WHY86063.1 hypothetical protein QNH39_26405 [Neobacillus novalis]
MKIKSFRNILKHLFWWALGVVLYFYIDDHWFRNIIVNISVIAMVTSYLFPWSEWLHEKDLRKERSNAGEDLYKWSDTLVGGDNYLEYLFKSLKPSALPNNINLIYKRILMEANNNIEELRLLRAYFKAYKERQTLTLYYKTVGTGFLSFVIFGIQAILQGRITDQHFVELFHPYNSWGFIFSIIIIALYFFLLPHRGENRINLVINILDESIEQIGLNKEKSNSSLTSKNK